MKINPITKNQFIVTDDDGTEYFQSYSTIIAKRAPGGRVTLDRDKWDYSKTTGRYRGQFLGENKVETLKKIKSGEYRLDNLNENVSLT